MPRPIVEFDSVSFGYTTSPNIEDVTFALEPKEAVCIVGPNGSGKTTLLKLMLGLIKPNTGSIRIFGEDPVHARKRIGYVPQHILYDPLFPITVLEIVLMARLGKSKFSFQRRAGDLEAARHALADVGLEGLEEHSFQTLSGGQKQRVLIARALACEPELLLLDEPTANLDLAVEFQLLETLMRHRKDITLIMVSHDLDFVSKAVEKVLCVNRRVAVHRTGALSEKMIQETYGPGLRIIRHDEHCHHD